MHFTVSPVPPLTAFQSQFCCKSELFFSLSPTKHFSCCFYLSERNRPASGKESQAVFTELSMKVYKDMWNRNELWLIRCRIQIQCVCLCVYQDFEYCRKIQYYVYVCLLCYTHDHFLYQSLCIHIKKKKKVVPCILDK